MKKSKREVHSYRITRAEYLKVKSVAHKMGKKQADIISELIATL